MFLLTIIYVNKMEKLKHLIQLLSNVSVSWISGF